MTVDPHNDSGLSCSQRNDNVIGITKQSIFHGITHLTMNTPLYTGFYWKLHNILSGGTVNIRRIGMRRPNISMKMEYCLCITKVAVSTKAPRSFHVIKVAFDVLLCNGFDY